MDKKGVGNFYSGAKYFISVGNSNGIKKLIGDPPIVSKRVNTDVKNRSQLKFSSLDQIRTAAAPLCRS